jgi:hypothetical protein
VLKKLQPIDYSILEGFRDLHSFPLISSVIRKRQAGSIFVNATGKITFVFIIHKSGFSYLFEEKENHSTIEDFTNLINTSSDIPDYFHIYDPPLSYKNYIQKSRTFEVKLRKRIQLRFGNSKILSPPLENKNNKFTSHKISPYNFPQLDSFDLGIESKFWDSKEDFLKSGFGVFITVNDIAASVCYTACTADAIAEVDIVTKPEFQRLGLGKFITSQFINYGLDKGIVSNWDCFENNIGSYKLATDIGFKPIRSYDFLSIFVKSKSIE